MKSSERGGGETSAAPRPFRPKPTPNDHSILRPSPTPEPSHSPVPNRNEHSILHPSPTPEPSPNDYLILHRRPRPDLGEISHSPFSLAHDLPDSAVSEVPKEHSRSTEQLKSFLGRTLKAFGQALLRTAMHSAGLGPVYEICHWAIKAANAVKGLVSDHGAELSLPVPVGGVDLMVSVTVGDDENGEHRSPITMFVAPGEDSLAAAVEIGPAEQGEQSAQPADARKETASPNEPDIVVAPVYESEVQMYGDVAVATMDLSALNHGSRSDRAAVLRDVVERELRPLLMENDENQGLALVIGYDPAMALAFWVDIDPDSSRVWRVVAEYDRATGRLLILQVTPTS